MRVIDRTIASVLLVTGLSNCAYALIAPILPFVLDRKGISQRWSGYIFSILPIAVVMSSPLISKLMSRVRRRMILRFGITLMGISYAMFAFIPLI